jgi:hypothetical protein
MDSVGQSRKSKLKASYWRRGDGARRRSRPGEGLIEEYRQLGASANTGPFGETIAGDHRPTLKVSHS